MIRIKSPKLKIDILTLFPAMFHGPFDESIIKRAIDRNLVEVNIHNLRDWAKDKHKTVDDRPYGGGVGMILKPEPVFDAVEELRSHSHRHPEERSDEGSPQDRREILRSAQNDENKVILLSPQGQPFNQKMARKLSKLDHLILICGRYEGVDERVREHLIEEEVSIGDYVLTGGEIPAMVLTDAIVRLIPGVLKKPEAIAHESFQSLAQQQAKNSRGVQALTPPCLAGRRARCYVLPSQFLDFPQYTRPENFRGCKVPKVLLSGDHKKIAQWRKEQSLLKTRKNRPDLLGTS